jgi:hypothetical protein
MCGIINSKCMYFSVQRWMHYKTHVCTLKCIQWSPTSLSVLHQWVDTLWPEPVSGFLCCVNKADLMAGWRDDYADLDWQKVPKRKTVCSHEAWSKPQCSRFCCFFFCFCVACCLQIMCFGLHSSHFGWRSALIDLFFAWLLRRMRWKEVRTVKIRREPLEMGSYIPISEPE